MNVKNDFPIKKQNFLWKDEYVIYIEKNILQFYGHMVISDLPGFIDNNNKHSILIKDIIHFQQKKRFHEMLKKEIEKMIDEEYEIADEYADNKEKDDIIENWWVSCFEKNIHLQKIIVKWFFHNNNINDNDEKCQQYHHNITLFIKNFEKYHHIHDKKVRLYLIWLLYFQKIFDLENIISQKKADIKKLKQQEKYGEEFHYHYYQDSYLPYPIAKKRLRTIIELPLKTENEITMEEFIQTWNRCYKRYNNIEYWNVLDKKNKDEFHDKLGWIVYKILQEWEKQLFCIQYFEERKKLKINENTDVEIKKIWWDDFERFHRQPWGLPKKRKSLLHNYTFFWLWNQKNLSSSSEVICPFKFKTNFKEGDFHYPIKYI